MQSDNSFQCDLRTHLNLIEHLAGLVPMSKNGVLNLTKYSTTVARMTIAMMGVEGDGI